MLTGAGGRVGRVLREGLGDDYPILGIDIRNGPGVDVVADMTRLDRIRSAFAGAQAVIDLAGDPRVSLDWEGVRKNNIPATINAFEAARLAGVPRVVYASSNHVTGMYGQDEPYTSIIAGKYDGLVADSVPRIGVDAPLRPDGPYAVGKALGEATGRYYSEVFGLSVICLRLGQVNLENRPKNPSHFSTLLTHRDLVHLVRCCLEAAPSVRFEVFYGVSANTWRIWDIEPARVSVGYHPEDDAETFR